MTRLPSLNALRAFEALGRTGSVRAAAEELAVSPTVVSRHVQNLEVDLGLDLVEPRGRGLALTAQGRALYKPVGQAFDLLRRAVHEARPHRRESLVIWCTPGVANRRLLPLLPDLQTRLKPLDVILQPTLARPDFDREEADVEIVYLHSFEPTANRRAELLASPCVHAVASPAFRARYEVGTAADLLALPLVHEESTAQWEAWFRAQGIAEVPALRGPRLWHAHLAIEAARLGQGVALANGLLVEEDLAAGRLVDLVPSDVVLGGYYLVGPADHWRDPAITALRTWLKEVLRPAATRAEKATVAPRN
jgi:LysR family glycine cleavage system transcriptional activator